MFQRFFGCLTTPVEDVQKQDMKRIEVKPAPQLKNTGKHSNVRRSGSFSNGSEAIDVNPHLFIRPDNINLGALKDIQAAHLPNTPMPKEDKIMEFPLVKSRFLTIPGNGSANAAAPSGLAWYQNKEEDISSAQWAHKKAST